MRPFREVSARIVFACVAIAGLTGLIARFALPDKVRTLQRAGLDLRSILAPGESLGEGVVLGRTRASASLSIEGCDQDVALTAWFVGAAEPHSAGTEHAHVRSVYVFRGQEMDGSPRIWAHGRYLLSRAVDGVLLSMPDRSDQFIFRLDSPAGCRPRSGLAASLAATILTRARQQDVESGAAGPGS